jgi:hypothetical protein
MQRKALLFVPLLVALPACVSTPSRTSAAGSFSVPAAWLSAPQTPRIRAVSLSADGKVITSPDKAPRRTVDGAIHVANEFVAPRIMNGEKQLTDPFRAIDSLDLSEERQEVAFSVKRRDDFEIGLVASDGSPISWIPNDPSDETDVQWAPRGNKISYVIRAKSGDIVRTLHIPTSFELAVAFPYAIVQSVGWDPAGERYAVAYSTPDASDRVEVMKYDGTARHMAVSPSARVNAEVEPFAPGAIVVRPRDLLYNEKLPVVVWVSDDYGWNDARGALMKSTRLAMVVAKRAPDDALWSAIAGTPWMDTARIYVVGGTGSRGVSITGDSAIPDGHYRQAGNVVTAAPAVVQSFAAGFIADQLKRNPLTNGSSR